jgi:hypothetical protein
MTNYVLAFTGGGGMPETDEQQQAAMAAWASWYETLGLTVADSGNPFGPSATISSDGSVSDGGASRLTGYTIITADSVSAASEAAKGCPILAAGGTVEVYETFQVM